MSCNNACPIIRNHLYNTSWELHHRTGYDSCGNGIHGGTHNEEFDCNFWNVAGNATNYIHVYTPSGYYMDWVGDIGVLVCKPLWHGYGRAFDLTQVRFTNGDYFDMNADWNTGGCSSLFYVRRYLGVAAALRRYVGTVLTAWYNADHQNHIHFDNGVAVGPINSGWRTDTTLVQATCNYLNGESLAIDGDWGPLTNAAYGRLLTKLKMQCKNPRGNTGDALLFLHLIARTGFAAQPAGYFVGPC